MRERCVFWTRVILACRFLYLRTAVAEAYSSCTRKRGCCFQVQGCPNVPGVLAIQSRPAPSTGFAKASRCNKSEAFGLSVVLKLCRWTPGSAPTITRWGEWSLEGELSRHDKEYCLCTLKRQLSNRELRHFGFRNVPVFDSNETQPSTGRVCCRLTIAFQISAGRRFWVIGHCRLAVQIRLRVSVRIAQSGRATVLSKSPLARCCERPYASTFDGPKLWVIACNWFDSSGRLNMPA